MTFRDPESARRACSDPTPIIDGRRANCNLASLGRPRPPISYGIICLFGFLLFKQITLAVLVVRDCMISDFSWYVLFEALD